MNQTQDSWKLHAKLKRAAGYRTPRGDGSEPRQIDVIIKIEQRGDDCRIPGDRRRVGNEEAMMAVQNSQAPRREHEHAGAGEEDPDERDRQVSSLIFKTGGDDCHDVRRGEHADQNDHGGDEREDPEDRIRNPCGFLFVVLGQQPGIDRNERSGKCAFAEDVLQEVGNAKRRAEGVAFRGAAEIVGEDSLPDETDDPADENSRTDEERRSTSAGWFWFRRRRWFDTRGADLFDSFTGYSAGRFVRGDFGVSGQRAYSFILLRSVL